MAHDATLVRTEQGYSALPSLLPLVVTKQPGSLPGSLPELGHPTSPPFSCLSSSPASTLSTVRGGSPERQELDESYADIEHSHQTNVSPLNIPGPFISREEKIKAWFEAILQKRQLVLQMLQTQKIIEEVEDEAAKYLTRDTIDQIHQEHYNLLGDHTHDGMFISAISSLKVTS